MYISKSRIKVDIPRFKRVLNSKIKHFSTIIKSKDKTKKFIKKGCINIIAMLLYKQLIGNINSLPTKGIKIKVK